MFETLDYVTLVVSVALGTAGGIAHVIMWSEHWDDLKKFSSFKRTVIGGIVGFLYTFLHSDYGFPNFVMTFVAGYMGTDFLLSIVEKLTKKQGNNQ